MTKTTSKIAITMTCDSLLKKARKLALKLNLPIAENNPSCDFILTITPDKLELKENDAKRSKPIFVDFLSNKLNYRTKHGGGKKQLIAKAVGSKNKKNLFVIDATAGFGTDSFILANLGHKVLMLERSPIIGALLEDGLKHLKKELNLKLKITDSYDYIYKLTQKKSLKPDVIYLDPMYPKKTKSALNKKTMRILSKIVGNDDDAAKLLEISLKCAKNRVVVKRPKLAENLGDLKPDLQFFSNGSCRYDVYFPKPQTIW